MRFLRVRDRPRRSTPNAHAHAHRRAAAPRFSEPPATVTTTMTRCSKRSTRKTAADCRGERPGKACRRWQDRTGQKRERGRNGQPTWPFLPSFPGHQRSVQVRENSVPPNPTFPPGHSSDLVATGLPQPACNSGLRMLFSRSRSSEARSLIQTVSCGKGVKGFEGLQNGSNSALLGPSRCIPIIRSHVRRDCSCNLRANRSENDRGARVGFACAF